MDVKQLIADLQRDEAVRRKPYDDKTGLPLPLGAVVRGKITIGVGRNLTDRGLSDDEIGYLLANDLRDVVEAELDRHAPWWRKLPEPAARGLANMCFNLGWPRLSAFKAMLTALKSEDWETAAQEALDSLWAKQVGDRADRIADLYRSCK